MIVVNATIETTPEDLEAVRDALVAMETASRQEHGCEDYTFSVELDIPTRLRLTERWKDAAALEAHFASPHMATFNQAMAAHPPQRIDVRFYEATEIPRPGSNG